MPIGINKASRNSQITRGPPDGKVDNFEESLYEDKSNSLSDYYSGDLTSYSRVTSTVLEGSYSLEWSVNQSDFIYSLPTDGLPNYPVKGDKVGILVRAGSGGEPEIAIATPDSSQSDVNLGYCCRVSAANDKIQITKRLGGATVLSDVSATISAGSDYELVIQWHDGSGSLADNTIEITLYNYDIANQSRGSEVATTNAQDSDGANNDGIGYIEAGNNAPTNYTDRYKILGTVD